MAEGDDQEKDQKTEEPTSKKLQEAFDKGNVPFSKEIGSFLMLLLLTIIIGVYSSGIMKDATNLIKFMIISPELVEINRNTVSALFYELSMGSIAVLSVPLIGAVIVALASGLLQNGVVISAESLKPKLNKISPLKGLKRLFSKRTLFEFLKNLIKISIVSTVAFVSIYPEIGLIKLLSNNDIEVIMLMLAKIATRLMIGISIAMFFIALIDLIYQRLKHVEELRMTKQEVKDEYKQTEGDPMVKQRLRALRQERAKQRMMADVPKSDVVITNPTHFAVALSYNPNETQAPVVVAKGQDLIALKIREVAEEHDIPIVENPPLARALFDSTDIEQEIPITHYEAVAKIISYVYELKGRKL